MKALKLSILLAIILISCDETKKVIDTAGNLQLSGSYTISSLGDKAVTENAPTITFNALEKGVKGNTGCNSFFGNYALDLYALSFSDIASTEMACDEPIMSNEIAFLNALRDAGSYSLENNVLTLYSALDRSVLFKADKDNSEE